MSALRSEYPTPQVPARQQAQRIRRSPEGERGQLNPSVWGLAKQQFHLAVLTRRTIHPPAPSRPGVGEFVQDVHRHVAGVGFAKG